MDKCEEMRAQFDRFCDGQLADSGTTQIQAIRKRSDGRWEGRYTAGYNPTTGKRIIKNVLGKTQAECKAKAIRPFPL